MRVRLAAALIAFTATAPAAAQENPWTMIKGMFHEPVTELKQQLLSSS